MLEVTVKVNKLERENSNIVGLAQLNFGGQFKVKSIDLVNGKDGVFVSMPSYKTNEVDANGKPVYKEICNPITKECREALYNGIIEAYNSGTETVVALNYDEKLHFDSRVTAFDKEGTNAKGIGTLYLNDMFVCNNILVYEGKNKPFVSMPSYKTSEVDANGKPVYKDICYGVTAEAKKAIDNTVLGEYSKSKERFSLVDKVDQAIMKAAGLDSSATPQHNRDEQTR